MHMRMYVYFCFFYDQPKHIVARAVTVKVLKAAASVVSKTKLAHIKVDLASWREFLIFDNV